MVSESPCGLCQLPSCSPARQYIDTRGARGNVPAYLKSRHSRAAKDRPFNSIAFVN